MIENNNKKINKKKNKNSISFFKKYQNYIQNKNKKNKTKISNKTKKRKNII